MRATLAAVLVAIMPTCAALADTGEQSFTERCAPCHQPDGAGAAGLAPPLKDVLKPHLTSPAGKQYLSQILVSGMSGKIDTQDGPFIGLMPSFKQLDDVEIAATIDYVLTRFNGATGEPVQPDDVAKARAAAPNATDTRHLRETLRAAGQ